MSAFANADKAALFAYYDFLVALARKQGRLRSQQVSLKGAMTDSDVSPAVESEAVAVGSAALGSVSSAVASACAGPQSDTAASLCSSLAERNAGSIPAANATASKPAPSSPQTKARKRVNAPG